MVTLITLLLLLRNQSFISSHSQTVIEVDNVLAQCEAETDANELKTQLNSNKEKEKLLPK